MFSFIATRFPLSRFREKDRERVWQEFRTASGVPVKRWPMQPAAPCQENGVATNGNINNWCTTGLSLIPFAASFGRPIRSG